jgi:cytochrome c oxidase assembly factor CtaG
MSKVVSHWSADAVVLVAVGAVVAVHLLGMRSTFAEAKRLARPRPAGAVAQAVAFYCGLCALLVALVSPLAYWAGHFIWVRSLQDVLLAVVAPGLIVLGAPWLVLARGAACLRSAQTSPAPSGVFHGRVEQDRPGSPAPLEWSWLAWPVVVTAAFNVSWLGWHLPGPYDAAVRHPAAGAAEVITYLGLGIAWWLQLIGSRPLAPRFAPMSRFMLVAATVAATSVLAMVLMFDTAEVYHGYAGPAHRVLSVVSDQQVGGAVLFAVALPPLIVVAVALCIRWLATEESEALNAGFDRLLKPRASAWPSRPGLR